MSPPSAATYGYIEQALLQHGILLSTFQSDVLSSPILTQLFL